MKVRMQSVVALAATFLLTFSVLAALPDPAVVSRRISEQFLSTEPDAYEPVGMTKHSYVYGGRKHIHYSTVSLWVNAFECARLAGQKDLEKRLLERYREVDRNKSYVWHKLKHVDYEVTGAVPLEVAILTGDDAARRQGLFYADRQWEAPLQNDDTVKPTPGIDFKARVDWYKKGYSSETRLWIDDMYMIGLLQLQAYRCTDDIKYLDRAAREMALYLDRLPKREGLFFHAPNAPFIWARGNGWMAGAMPMILKEMRIDHPLYGKIMGEYKLMMASLLKHQRASGLWGQLVDDAESWDETSGSAMYAYAFAEGVKHGWLGDEYRVAMEKAYVALVNRLDEHANLADVCIGTGARDNREWYMARTRVNGDPHGQAPLLWLCKVLLDKSTIADRGFVLDLCADRPDCMYKLGEETTFTVKATFRDGRPATSGKLNWTLNNFGDKVFASGTVDLATKADGVFTVKGAQTEPGFLRLDVRDAKKRGGQPRMWGVAYSPREIVPGTPYPDDFMDFWKDAIAKYDREFPGPVEMVEVDKNAESTMWMLKIPSTQGRTVYGFYSEPNDKSKGPFPLKVHVPGAGPSIWGCDRGADACGLKVNVHYYDPTPVKGVLAKTGKSKAIQDQEDKEYAKRYPVKTVRYTQTGIAVSREDYFYYGIILAANRAVNWATDRQAVDRKRVWYSGGSQGGGFGLILTGLNPRITNARIGVPAITDLLGDRISKREAGWPRLIDAQLPENRAAAEKNAPYFCGVNFARQIKCPIVFGVGFIDTVCPPHAGYSAFNCCPSKEKAIFHGIGAGHSIGKKASDEMEAWISKYR